MKDIVVKNAVIKWGKTEFEESRPGRVRFNPGWVLPGGDRVADMATAIRVANRMAEIIKTKPNLLPPIGSYK